MTAATEQQSPGTNGSKRRALLPEVGWPGVQLFGGFVVDDYNPDLRGVKAITTADQMRRSDAQVRAVEKVLSLPLRATVWLLEEPDQPSAAETEAAELLRGNLFGGMEQTFDDLLREAALAIYYGFRVPEIVWEERSGVLAIRKIASRNPRLIERWLYDENGQLVGYLYAGHRPVGFGLSLFGGSTVRYDRVPVPIDKTLHLVYDQEYESPTGLGIWRSMYPHWYYKQALYKILAIGCERNLLGVPVATQGEGAQADDDDAILTQLKRLRAAEDAALRLPQGWTVDWFESHRSPVDAMPLLAHHDTKIAQAGLAQFLNLGQGQRGSQALASEQIKIFLDAEEANARWIEQTLTNQLVKRWASLNYGDGLRPPTVRHRRIGGRTMEALSLMLQQLVSGSLVHPTVQDEEYIRDLAELPAVPPEQLLRMEAERKAAQPSSGAPEGTRPGQPRGEGLPTGDLPGGEQAIRLAAGAQNASAAAAARSAREARETTFADQAQQHLTGIQVSYLHDLRPILEETHSGDAASQGQAIERLNQVPLPGAARYAEFLRGWLWQVLYEGRQSIAQETGQAPSTEPASHRESQWVGARAEAIAVQHLTLLRAEILNRVLTGVRAGLPVASVMSDAEASGAERLQRLVGVGWNQAGMELADQAGRD